MENGRESVASVPEGATDEGASNAFRVQLMHVRTSGVASRNVVIEQRASASDVREKPRHAAELSLRQVCPAGHTAVSISKNGIGSRQAGQVSMRSKTSGNVVVNLFLTWPSSSFASAPKSCGLP